MSDQGEIKKPTPREQFIGQLEAYRKKMIYMGAAALEEDRMQPVQEATRGIEVIETIDDGLKALAKAVNMAPEKTTIVHHVENNFLFNDRRHQKYICKTLGATNQALLPEEIKLLDLNHDKEVHNGFVTQVGSQRLVLFHDTFILHLPDLSGN